MVLTLARDVMAIVTWIWVTDSPIKCLHRLTKVGANLARCDSSVHRDCGNRVICQLILALPLSVRRALCRYRVAACYQAGMLEATRIFLFLLLCAASLMPSGTG